MECDGSESNEQNFPIYQYPARVVDVEADPSEEAAAAPCIFRLFRAILVQKCLWPGPGLFLILANI